MSEETKDQGLEVLLKILHMKGLKDYENLLKKCYEIQKKFQYEPERNIPLVHMQKLIEKEVSADFDQTVEEGEI